MAKGNLLLGMARGKVGDIVVTRGAGEQISRARNRNPKNPKTTKQMAQRAALATVVEFFTRGKRNLFKFAFESKRKGESDYNAFVRANINRVPVQSRKTLAENGPVFGEFVMSQGSLSQPAFLFDGDHVYGALQIGSSPEPGATLTIGQLSKAIEDYNALQDGDIITIVGISAPGEVVVDSLPEAIEGGALASGGYPTIWVIKQFTLDSASTTLVSTLGIFEVADIAQGAATIGFSGTVFGNIDAEGDAPAGIAVIASRVSASGVKVSTSSIKLAINANNTANIGMSDDWKIWVAQHWNDATSLDVAPDNILEGSISEN